MFVFVNVVVFECMLCLYVLEVFLNWSLADSYGFWCLSHIQWTTLRFSVEALFMAWFLQVGPFFRVQLFLVSVEALVLAFKKGRSFYYSYLLLISVDCLPSRNGIFHQIFSHFIILKPPSCLDVSRINLPKLFANFSVFSEAFKAKDEVESDEIFKSVGIDKEGGLVFTLDTLQANNCFKTLDLFFTLDTYRPPK